MRSKTFGLKVGAGFEVVEEFADGFEVIGLGELVDGNGECYTIEMRLRGE